MKIEKNIKIGFGLIVIILGLLAPFVTIPWYNGLILGLMFILFGGEMVYHNHIK
jgi:predicted membrane metal-binding protein